MNEQCFVVSDQLWRRLEPHLPGKTGDAGATAKDNRLFRKAVFRRVRTASPWRDLPPGCGNWYTQFHRFRRWAKAGVFENLFRAMSNDPDFEYARIDGTIVQVHQKARGAKEGLSIKPSGARAAGLRPRGVALMDVLGHLVRFLLPRRAHDMKGVAPLLRDVSFGALLADGVRCELALEGAGHPRRKCRDRAEIQPKAAA